MPQERLDITPVHLPVGTVLLYDGGQRYEVVKAEPYERKRDGAHTSLVTWRTHCPVCGAAFELTGGVSRFPTTRRCPVHRSRSRVVASEAAPKTRTKQTALNDSDQRPGESNEDYAARILAKVKRTTKRRLRGEAEDAWQARVAEIEAREQALEDLL